MAKQTPPCRLFVILARDEPVAVIIRRGPSLWSHILLWETQRDVVTPGAWFKGRIYENKCDVSPNGKLFVYSAYKKGYVQPGYTAIFTAVSRPPWLSAVALWRCDTTYGGGGRFLDDRRIAIRFAGELEPHPDHCPRHLKVVDGPLELHQSLDLVDGAQWSGVDCRCVTIYARDGKLFRRPKRRRQGDVEVADLNNLLPNPQPPPDWATRPL